jgi:DNA repair protein RecN (Recombination protein N)
VEIDPSRLGEVENRLDRIYDIARKHRVRPEQLAEVRDQLNEELDGLKSSDARMEELRADMSALQVQFQLKAAKLSKARQRAAKKLTTQVEKQLAELAMGACRFEVSLKRRDQEAPHPHGLEEVEFRISTNPGQEPQALGKIASGGELSRISLAIQVVTASTGTVPSMVFDEVDVGIGGAVAEVVGRLLRRLAESAQVLCVTHLPQVASQGHQHLRVSKSADNAQALTTMAELSSAEKVEEIARMLGGIDVTEQARAHAENMLESARL